MGRSYHRGLSSVPITLALVAGGLAVVNPCGFPLLPAFLSFYLGADEARLPYGRTRVLRLLGASWARQHILEARMPTSRSTRA
jgi:cytochrome c biogenesis protein CcdA